MLKNYFKKKSKLSIIIDVLIGILVVFLLIPATRKQTAALIMRPTLFIHQPKFDKSKPLIGDKAYEWKLRDMAGNQVNLSDYKDQVLFINFWATWCPPCLAEMPDLQTLYNDYHKKVTFLFVNNENQSVVEPFMAKKGYTLPVYFPVTDYPEIFSTRSLPTTFIVSKKGELIVKQLGVAQWNSQKIRTLLDALSEAKAN